MARPGQRLSAALLALSKRQSRQNLLPWLREALDRLAPGAELLSVGANGETADMARDVAGARGLHLLSTDIDPDCGPDLVDDITASRLQSDRFDAIMVSEVMEHVADPFAAARELERLLKPGGLLIASTPFIYPIHARPHDYWRFTRYGLFRLFAAFEGVEVRERNGWAEAILVLQGRLVLEPGRGALAAAAILGLAGLLFARPAAWLSRLAPSDFVTSGYVVTARKRG